MTDTVISPSKTTTAIAELMVSFEQIKTINDLLIAKLQDATAMIGTMTEVARGLMVERDELREELRKVRAAQSFSLLRWIYELFAS